MSARDCLAATMLVCVAVALTGCGGGSSTASGTAESHAAALANSVCGEINAYVRGLHLRSGTAIPQSERERIRAYEESQIARVRALMSAARKLQGAGTLLSDLTAREGLKIAMGKVARKEGDVANALSYIDDAYRLDVKIAADEKAVGLTSCIGPPPRKPIGG